MMFCYSLKDYGKLLFAAILATGSLSTVAEELYQYMNSDGQLEISKAIPPDLVPQGYIVINEHGRILRTISAQLTPSQRQKKAVQDKIDQEKQDLLNWEDELMLRYSSPRDVDYARDQKIGAIETRIATTMLNIDRLQVQKQELENRAANMERAGQTLSPSLLNSLNIVNEQIQGRQDEVDARKAEQEKTNVEFSRIMQKIRELYGLPQEEAERPVKMDLSNIDH